jgi:hypothetical protein
LINRTRRVIVTVRELAPTLRCVNAVDHPSTFELRDSARLPGAES